MSIFSLESQSENYTLFSQMTFREISQGNCLYMYTENQTPPNLAGKDFFIYKVMKNRKICIRYNAYFKKSCISQP